MNKPSIIQSGHFIDEQGGFNIFCVRISNWECLENNTKMDKFHIAEESLMYCIFQWVMQQQYKQKQMMQNYYQCWIMV